MASAATRRPRPAGDRQLDVEVVVDAVATVMSFTVDHGRIVGIDVQRNPEKLRKLP
jgi:hypothetical protein